MSQRILIVEDSMDFQQQIKRTLGERYFISCASSGREAFDATNQAQFDLVLLDVGLPDMTGFQVCAQFRSQDSTRDVPIIFLSGLGAEVDKVTAFSLGADDYLVKPFGSAELKARIESKLRRRPSSIDSGDWITKRDLSLSASLHQAVLTEGESKINLDLTPNEFKLLHYLARHENHVLSREQLLQAVWEQRGIHVSDRTVDKHVSALRKKLLSKAPYIQTVSNLGYRFSTSS